MKHVFADYEDRKGRARFIISHFRKYFDSAKTVLDVGCDDNRLKPDLGSKVVGIDIEGTPDHIVDLEKERLSKFPDSSFDALVCTDVLEHIDNLYDVLDDMVRVSKGQVIISLPNCGHIFRLLPVLVGKSSGKFYGLPHTPPVDRHKWFFNWRELHSFFQYYAKQNGLRIEEEFITFNYSSAFRRSALKLVSHIMPITTFAQGYWVVLSKDVSNSAQQR